MELVHEVKGEGHTFRSLDWSTALSCAPRDRDRPHILGNSFHSTPSRQSQLHTGFSVSLKSIPSYHFAARVDVSYSSRVIRLVRNIELWIPDVSFLYWPLHFWFFVRYTPLYCVLHNLEIIDEIGIFRRNTKETTNCRMCSLPHSDQTPLWPFLAFCASEMSEKTSEDAFLWEMKNWVQKRLEAYEFHIDWLVLYITNVQNSRYEVDSIKKN